MPDLERIQQNTATTISEVFYSDGTAVDAGTVTVTITRADGTALVTGAATVASGSPNWAYAYDVTTANTALLDRLTVTWTSSTKGTLTSYLEITGGFFFTVAEAKAINLGGSTTIATRGFTTAQITAMRTSVEQAIEDEYGSALVPRYERQTLQGPNWGEVNLKVRWPNVRTVREASIAGSDITSFVEIDGLLGLYYSAGWTVGRSNVIVGYEHGLDRPPERVRRGALLLLKRWLVDGPVDDRTTSMSNDDGTFTLATPGRGGSVFGLPDLDAAIMASPYRVGVA